MCEVAVNQSIEVGRSQSLIKDLIAREICKMLTEQTSEYFFFHLYSFLFFHSFFCLFVFDSFFLLFLKACSRMFGDLILKTCATI